MFFIWQGGYKYMLMLVLFHSKLRGFYRVWYIDFEMFFFIFFK